MAAHQALPAAVPIQQVVETLRAIAELMIWGDQHNANFFEYVACSHHHNIICDEFWCHCLQ
jgi:hypothetical protein